MTYPGALLSDISRKCAWLLSSHFPSQRNKIRTALPPSTQLCLQDTEPHGDCQERLRATTTLCWFFRLVDAGPPVLRDLTYRLLGFAYPRTLNNGLFMRGTNGPCREVRPGVAVPQELSIKYPPCHDRLHSSSVYCAASLRRPLILNWMEPEKLSASPFDLLLSYAIQRPFH